MLGTARGVGLFLLAALTATGAAAQDATADSVAPSKVDTADDEGGGFSFASNDRVLNRLGFVGVRRTTSARVYGPVAATAQLSGGGFYLPDFLGPDADQQVIVRARGAAALGFFDIAELSAQAVGAGTENTIGDFSTRQAAPQFSVGLKLNPVGAAGLFLDAPLPVAAGLAAQVTMPARLNGIVPDYVNLSASIAGLFTVDLADSYGLPFRAHLNVGYRYQNAHYLAPADTRARYFLQGVDQHVLAAAGDLWWYDQAFGGFSVEVPLPFVTPFVEAWWQGALLVPAGRGAGGADYNFLLDPHTVITPGVRVTPFQGFTFELFCDVGPTGNAGFLPPTLDAVVDGQPVNPLYFAGGSLTVSMDGFAAALSGASDEPGDDQAKRPALAPVEVCVTDAGQKPLSGARVSFADGALPDSLTDDKGCVRSYAPVVPGRSVTVTKDGYEGGSVTLQGEAPGAVALKKAVQKATIQGSVRAEADDTPLDGVVDLSRPDGSGFVEADVTEGRFSVEVEAGLYVMQAASDGYLRTGKMVVVEPGGTARVQLGLKKATKRRMAKLAKERIETSAKVAFSSGSAELLSAAAFVLDDVVDVLLVERDLRKVEVVVLAKNDKGLEAAQARADVVKAYLEEHGVLARRLSATARVVKKGEKAGALFFDIVERAESPTAPTSDP